MHTRDVPPTRTSSSATVQVKPFGPHQRSTRSGSVHDFQAASMGAGMSRLTTRSCVSCWVVSFIVAPPLQAAAAASVSLR
jgi:hypothetical protein